MFIHFIVFVNYCFWVLTFSEVYSTLVFRWQGRDEHSKRLGNWWIAPDGVLQVQFPATEFWRPMRVLYRRHEIVANAVPSGVVVFDIYDSRKQHLLAGFSSRDENEQSVVDRMKTRVDQFIAEADLAPQRSVQPLNEYR